MKKVRREAKSARPRVNRSKTKDPTDLEESPLKNFQKTNGGKLKRRRNKDLYRDGCRWLAKKRANILSK
jgi:hypothetical protein